MDNLFGNTWVSGVVSSLIASVIVFCITQIYNVVKHKKRIDAGNNFVLNQLRAYVVDEGIPTDDILNALRRSAARRFKVRESELLSLPDFMEETVAEILGNVYLKKAEQSQYLSTLNRYLVEHHRSIELPRITHRQTRLIIFIRCVLIILTLLASALCIMILSNVLYAIISEIFYPVYFESYHGNLLKLRIISLILSIVIVAFIVLSMFILFGTKLMRNIERRIMRDSM